MRRLLDTLYTSAAALAALFMVGLLLMVLLSIVSRQMGFHAKGVDAYAGYLMAASGFLALAHTLTRGEHIRVTMLLKALRGSKQRALEIFAASLGALLSLLFAFYSTRLAWQSYQFNDISTGNDATPLWIPQLAMALGSIVFAIAMLDECVLTWLGKKRSTENGEALRNE
jgi:TRAP-type C4-dicarboxylate transport system permease small subunit